MIDPEILIIDEVLAVGDFEFQKKCLSKMHDVAGSGRTVLFVSHNMSAVTSLCSRGIVLHQGNKLFDGALEASVKTYLQVGDRKSTVGAALNGKYFKRAILLDPEGNETNVVQMGNDIIVDVSVVGIEFGHGVHVGFFVTDIFGLKVGAVSTAMKEAKLLHSGDSRFRVVFTLLKPHLVENRYKIDLSLSYKSGGRIEFIENAIEFDVIGNDVYGSGVKLDSYFGMTYFSFDATVKDN